MTREFCGWARRRIIEWQYGDIIDDELYRVGDVEHPVLWIDGNESGLRGKATLFNNILLNRATLAQYSDEMEQRTFLHEVGHVQQHTLLSWLVTLLLLLLSVCVFVLFLSLPVAVVLSFLYTTFWVFVALIVALLVLSGWFFIKLWRWNERQAELFCLAHLGKEKFRKCAEEARQFSHHGRFWSFARRFLYPSPEQFLQASEIPADN